MHETLASIDCHYRADFNRDTGARHRIFELVQLGGGLTPHKALIQQSLRNKRNDHMWFTFFHEAAHILLHGKKERFLEIEGAESPKEREANTWAADFLIPPHEWNVFVQQYKGRYYENNITAFAQEQAIAPAIIAGRLQHERLVPPTWYKNLFVRLDFAPELYGG